MNDKEKKKVMITVDGIPFEVEKDEMTYNEIVSLEYPDSVNHPERTYSVTYERGEGNKPQGILSVGGVVKIKNEMRFYVKLAGES